ncbi:ubiquitin-protein transferase [Aureococcus anophagefferens]|nr:ubiquitin-protein transferase [Aureococcus anophagefferens]
MPYDSGSPPPSAGADEGGRVPVIAADGHTYDRSAIERWLLHHDNSPKTGERLEHRMLVPNHNLKRLVDDLVLEGGAGLYSSAEGAATPLCDAREERKTFETADDGMPRPPSSSGRPGGRRAELASEPVLLLQCLGPPESEWNGRSFEVSKNGVVGGRRRPSASGGAPDDGGGIGDRDFMPFADSTVSRRHFEICHDGGRFAVRDLGSASGTFRRLRNGAEAPLTLGAMAMIGKHQLCGKIFKITDKGATLGRRTTNAVAFSHVVDGEAVGVDSSVSAEHARVVFAGGGFRLADGTSAGKSSTNGTWIRLSGLHEKSDRCDLESGDELLIGTIRFHVTATHTVVERL